MKMNYNRELWEALEQHHPRYYCDDRVLEYDILYRYLDNGEEDVNKEDVPWMKTFSSEEEVISRMRTIEQQLYEEMIYYKSSVHRYASISMDRFMQESASLLEEIKSAKKSAFEIPASEAFMSTIGCTKLKASSKDKADIHIVIHDLRTNMTPLLGFSIKSQLGSASKLLNAGDPTNILYRVCGTELTDTQIDEINAVDGHLSRMSAIYNTGCSLQYADIEHETFKNNLLFLDSNMPQFIADCLLVDSMPDSVSDIKDAVERVANQNPLAFTGKNVMAFYEHKMKVLLLDAALGMTPAKEWNGRYDANGGYIVVRKDGEIVCYHFYNRNDVEDYLYCNTRFERASRSRYKYGSLFRGVDGNVYIRLNLQIRFKK